MIISRLCCSNLLTQYVLPLPVGPATNMVNGCCKITWAASNSNVFDITDIKLGVFRLFGVSILGRVRFVFTTCGRCMSR